MILALDPGLNCGWATSDGRHGVWHLSASSEEHAGKRLDRFMGLLEASGAGITRVAYEASHQMTRGQSARAMHNQLVGIVQLFAFKHGLPFESVHTATLKKFATGNGHALKADMMRMLKLHFSLVVNDDNEADAIWVLKFVEQRVKQRAAGLDVAKTKKHARRQRRRPQQPKLF